MEVGTVAVVNVIAEANVVLHATSSKKITMNRIVTKQSAKKKF